MLVADRPWLLLALDADQPHDRAVPVGYELDRGGVVVLLLPAHVVEEGRAEERQDTAAHPALLVGFVVRTDGEPCTRQRPILGSPRGSRERGAVPVPRAGRPAQPAG